VVMIGPCVIYALAFLLRSSMAAFADHHMKVTYICKYTVIPETQHNLVTSC